MIDIDIATNVFKKYIKNYNPENGKIALKIGHILRVSNICKDIAIKNNFNEEETKLAELIGLLHDIGRFEQVKMYNTFSDKDSINHAELGVKILFEEGLIREFIQDKQYDEIIKVSILNHNKSRIPEGLNETEEKFCKVIRDADKVDIFYVLTIDSLENCYGKENFSNDLITDEIYDEFMNIGIINYKNKKTYADHWVAHMAYIFDFNYNFCLSKIKEEKYIEKLLQKVNFTNSETIRKANEIVKYANEYMDKQLNN